MALERDDMMPSWPQSQEDTTATLTQIAPFPLAENLLLIAKNSEPEQAFAAYISDEKQEGSENKLELQQPFAPFIIDEKQEAEIESLSKREELLGMLDEEGSAENGKEEGEGGVEALRKGDAVLSIIDKQKEEIFENGIEEGAIEALRARHEPLTLTVEKEQVSSENGKEEEQIEAVVEGVESLKIIAEKEWNGENGNEEEEVEEDTAKPLDGREGEGFGERETGGSKDMHLVNGMHKFETLGGLIARERQETESRERVKGAGEEISGRASLEPNADTVADVMGNTSKKEQDNGDGDAHVASQRTPRTSVATSEGHEGFNHRSPSGTSIVGDILYSIAAGDEEGRNRQRILAFAAKRYATNVERNPQDHDALYNWALVLQESADSTGSELGPPGKDALLEEACKKYDAATRLCPTLHEAFYNWAIAISDRAKIRGRTKEAEELWKQACDRYDRSVQLNWNSPQALNNWGLALQELGAIVPLKEKRAIVRKAIRKFRAAIQLRFDFHRAVYNLGTVLYGLAEDTLRSGRKTSPKEPTPTELYSQSAIYIAAAHALKPDYPVYRSALRLVRPMLPLPYLKAGWLTIPPAGDSLAPHSNWMQLWFVLDHEALYEIEKVDRKSFAQSYSRRSSTVLPESSSASSSARPSIFRIEMEDIVFMAPCSDLSLPAGGGFCINTASGVKYLIAGTWEGMDGWVDAIRLVYTIYAQGKMDALAGVLAG